MNLIQMGLKLQLCLGFSKFTCVCPPKNLKKVTKYKMKKKWVYLTLIVAWLSSSHIPIALKYSILGIDARCNIINLNLSCLCELTIWLNKMGPMDPQIK